MKELIEFVERIRSEKQSDIDSGLLQDLGIQRTKEKVEYCDRIIKILKEQKKPTVTKAFVEEMTSRMEQMMVQKQKRQDREHFIRCEVLRNAGVEEEK